MPALCRARQQSCFTMLTALSRDSPLPPHNLSRRRLISKTSLRSHFLRSCFKLLSCQHLTRPPDPHPIAPPHHPIGISAEPVPTLRNIRKKNDQQNRRITNIQQAGIGDIFPIKSLNKPLPLAFTHAHTFPPSLSPCRPLERQQSVDTEWEWDLEEHLMPIKREARPQMIPFLLFSKAAWSLPIVLDAPSCHGNVSE